VRLPSRGGEVDEDRSPVVRVAPTADQPGLLEPVEVPGHRGALDPHAVGQLALATALRLGDDVEHEEGGEGFSVGGEDLLEVAPEELRGVDELPGDRALERVGCGNRSPPNG